MKIHKLSAPPRSAAQAKAVKNGTANPDAAALSEEALVDGLRKGRPEAYEVLLDRFEAPLYRFFFYSHGDHDRAEDQCGETFANMIHAIHKMRGDAGALRSFVFGVARNVMRKEWRKQSRRPHQASEFQLERLTDPEPSSFQKASARQALERALEAINQFGEPARQILLLRFVEEMPLAEVANVLDLPLGTVKSYIHRCRKQLRYILDEESS